MSRRRTRGREAKSAAILAACAALAGCHSAPPLPTMPPPAPLVAAPYDWRGLLIAPFGTALQAIPLTLHEVLLFREDPAAALPECYAADAPAPPFAGRTPDEYVLCFEHDRLARVQAAVHMTAPEAADAFAAACAAGAPSAAPESGSACEGRDGAIRFGVRRDDGILSITLDIAAVP